MKKMFIMAAGFLFSLSTFADVPYTFTAGAPAKAVEVNANFTDLESKICADLKGGLSAHVLTYTAKTAAVGSVVTIGGIDYTMVAVPFTEPSTGKQYKVKFPYDIEGGAVFEIQHIKAGSNCAGDTLISGFPAFIRFNDYYLVEFMNGDYYFGGSSKLWVDISIYDIKMTLDIRRRLGVVDVGTLYGDYDMEGEVDGIAHDTSEVTALDNLLDYISIEEL